MSRGLIAERAKLSSFVARRALLVAIARLNAHPFVRWRFAATATDRGLIFRNVAQEQMRSKRVLAETPITAFGLRCEPGDLQSSMAHASIHRSPCICIRLRASQMFLKLPAVPQ